MLKLNAQKVVLGDDRTRSLSATNKATPGGLRLSNIPTYIVVVIFYINVKN